MKAVMISVQPKWCEKIASGKKTVEVRKTRPKLETPFKCYIYCTKPNKKPQTVCGGMDFNEDELYRHPIHGVKYGDSIIEFMVNDDYFKDNILNGKIIGEFVCDDISKFTAEFTDGKTYEDIRFCYLDECEEEQEMILCSNEWENPNVCWLCRESCLSFEDLRNYIGENFHDIPFYGWHISNLVIYDNPKELFRFEKACSHDCCHCKYYYGGGLYEPPSCEWEDFELTRPPQSWCYVEAFDCQAVN